MADETKTASLPVMNESIQAELQAAFARIQSVPASRTLIDLVDADLWLNGVDGPIEAGSDQVDALLDGFDQPHAMIA